MKDNEMKFDEMKFKSKNSENLNNNLLTDDNNEHHLSPIIIKKE